MNINLNLDRLEKYKTNQTILVGVVQIKFMFWTCVEGSVGGGHTSCFPGVLCN